MPVSAGRQRSTAHVIVLGNEKGGSGKTTTALHLIVALLKAGRRVGSIDLDSRQQTLTRYIENRRDWGQRRERALELPDHRTVSLGADGHLQRNEDAEFAAFAEAVGGLENTCDFLVIDAPGNDNYLSRLGHSMADTLVTPINDSFLDFDVLATVDSDGFQVTGTSGYADMVGQSRTRRLAVDGGAIDWVVVRNRLSPLRSKNNRRVDTALNAVADALEFRVGPGLAERVIFRELFPCGLTLFDLLDDDKDVNVTMSHLAARIEVRALVNALRLPFREAVVERTSADATA